MLTEGTQLIAHPEPTGGATLITPDQRVIRLNRTGAACATAWQHPGSEPVEEAVRTLTRRYPHANRVDVERDVWHFVTVLHNAGALQSATVGEGVA